MKISEQIKENIRVLGILILLTVVLILAVCFVILPLYTFFGLLLAAAIIIILYIAYFLFLKKYGDDFFSNNSQIVKKFFLFTVIIIFSLWLVSQLCVIVAIENDSLNEVNKYAEIADKNLKGDTLAICWNLTSAYRSDYTSTYRVKDKTSSARKISECCANILYPLIYWYYKYDYGYEKAALFGYSGNCGEFSRAITYLINTTMEVPTRSIHFKGFDHEFPELYINNDWYVFDYTFTTPSSPIKIKDYSQYLANKVDNIYNCTADLTTMNEDNSLLTEHGFNKTFIEVQLSKWDLGSFDNVDVTLYVKNENSNSPKVEKRKSDSSGYCNFTVHSGIEYLVFAENDNSIGFRDIKPIYATETVNIELQNVR